MTIRSNTILLVEHDVTEAVPLISRLQDQGFRALHATDGKEALNHAHAARPDLVLLATMLPRMDGPTVCRTLRKDSVVPIIMLSANGHASERIRCLEIGADDVVARPFSFPELVARVNALLRRREWDCRKISPSRDRIVIGDVVLDRATQQVWQAGELIEMPQREFDLLRVLLEHAGQALPRQTLMNQVWGEGWVGYPRTLNVHIYRLRQKLEDNPADPRYIQTVRSFGYRFAEPAANGRQAQSHPGRSAGRTPVASTPLTT